MSGRDWELLIQGHLDGTATSEEVAELSERLETDGNARLVYLKMARIHATLATDGLDESSARASEIQLIDLRDKLDTLEKRQRPRRFALAIATAAAVIAVIAGIYVARPPTKSRRTF